MHLSGSFLQTTGVKASQAAHDLKAMQAGQIVNLTLDQAKYVATIAAQSGQAIPVSSQIALDKAGLELIKPGVFLAKADQTLKFGVTPVAQLRAATGGGAAADYNTVNVLVTGQSPQSLLAQQQQDISTLSNGPITSPSATLQTTPTSDAVNANLTPASSNGKSSIVPLIAAALGAFLLFGQ